MPQVSVIIPCFNAAALLDRTLQSLSSQAFRDYEVIVVDDGSRDDAGGIAGRYRDLPIRFVRLEHNRGVSAARNTGIASAQGEFIQFLDAGDVIAKGKFERQLPFFRGREEIAVVVSDYTVLYGARLREKVLCDGKGDYFDYLLHGNTLHLNAMLFRKTCLVAENGFDENLLQCEDWDLCFRLASRSYRFAYAPGNEALYIKVPHSLTMNIDRWLIEIEKMIALRDNDTVFHAMAGRKIQFLFSSIYFLAAWRSLYNGKGIRAVTYCVKSLRHSSAGFFLGILALCAKILKLEICLQGGEESITAFR